MKPFLAEDFLLQTDTAKTLYQEFARDMPILDYHCHLPVAEIADDRNFDNLTQIWLNGDHYKWRAMRANGIAERFITGYAADDEKFAAWAATVPKTLCNPLYLWTHLELNRYFGIGDRLLNPDTAADIYATCNAMLQTEEFSTRNLLRQMNVKVVCTTDDPVDDLSHHLKISADPSFEIKVLPAFRPDKAMAVETPEAFNQWVDLLAAAADVDIKDYESFLTALQRRHDFFHRMGCRLSDHGLEQPYAEDFSAGNISRIFELVRSGQKIGQQEILQFKSVVALELARMDAGKNWVQQFHLGALRNVNSRAAKALGPDTGFDTMGDFEMARPLAAFLDRLDRENKLAKTILYSLNPGDYDMLAAMIGNFQDGEVPGKMQFGAAWWYNDQKHGIERQLVALANAGLLSRFVGMLTDSRSFLSYPRHEYFRRILCNLLGNEVQTGEMPDDLELLGGLVKDICYYNAVNYFGFTNL
ncbi:MAG: glucuronate isomerase [Desulfobacterales bacterium]|nr:MAG: glucuronate isomerase [Desulfobacterales bacterium]